jgi:uncharacterized protein (DUF2249 family)
VELDVRDDLRSGREPFQRIMSAVGELRDEEVLHLRAIFEPVPLFGVLGGHGFSYESVAHAPDDWSVWFWRPDRVAHDGVPQFTPSHPTQQMPTNIIELDVRAIPPREKHPAIFRTFDGLAKGHSMVIINDHDPRPLRYQFAAERRDQFEWTYEAEGPDVWRVRIDRR